MGARGGRGSPSAPRLHDDHFVQRPRAGPYRGALSSVQLALGADMDTAAPPPTGNGAWTENKKQGVKDRWVYLLRPDDGREAALSVKDDSIMRRASWASYREPKWKGGTRFDPRSGGGDYKRFMAEGLP